ncbi:MAG: phage portal protein, partial [Thermodesulfovibrionia bacterium]|nr:phage portal protein [Thermodesulfovibrionia bacterium]
MNRLQLLKQAMTKSVIGDWFIRNMGMPDSDRVILDQAYSMSDLVYICVSTTARAISQVPLLLGTINNKGEWEELSNPADAGLMNLTVRPNYLMDYSSFIESIVSFLLLDGNAWVVPFPPDDATPISWWVVQKKFMSPLKNEQTGQLEGWHYKPSEEDAFRLEIGQVAHIFFWNPYDPLLGFAPLEAGKLSITTDYKAAKFNQIFFDQGATIGGVLSSEQNLNDAQVKRLKEEIDKKYSGYDKAHRMLILEGGLKYTQTAFSHKDILFPEVRGLDKERILQIFGMKKAILSVTDDLNKATAWQQEKAWWTGTNIPIMRMIESAFNFTFFEKMGIEARFDLASIEALQRDFADKVEIGNKLLLMGYTPNEINQRLELGFEDKDWRDYIWKKTSERAIGDDSPAVEEDRPPEPLVIEPEEEPPLLPEPEEEESIIIPKIELKPDFQQRGEMLWKDMVKQARPIEKIFKSKTKKMFFTWRNLVLSWFYDQAEKSLKDSNKPFIMTSPLTDIDELSIVPFDDLKAAADVLYEKTLLTGLETIALE